MEKSSVIAMIVELIKISFFHSYNEELSLETRLKNASDGHDAIIELIETEFHSEAMDYYALRATQDESLIAVQKKALKELNRRFKRLPLTDSCILPTSSFSSRTNLYNVSDIDITVTVNEDTFKTMWKTESSERKFNGTSEISTVLSSLGYEFKKTMSYGLPEAYHVFSKHIDGVEIETKVRQNGPSDYIIEIHRYMDNEYPKDIKPYVTYAKFLFKDDRELYRKLKYIIYNSTLCHLEIDRILPL